MRILALIPARGGSKRLPGKNIRVLGDKPLIVWSIDVAKDIAEICEVLISKNVPNVRFIFLALLRAIRPNFMDLKSVTLSL
jgi:CMP-2-keto-3-deoxyoctulosonic acid synthetase